MASTADAPYGLIMIDARPTHPDAAENASGPTLTERAFWYVFASGWIALFGLLVSGEAMAERGFGRAVVGAFIGVGSPAALAVIVALKRRHLLRPEWTLVKTVGVHAGVGVLYAVGAAVLATVLTAALGHELDEATLEMSPWAIFFFRTVSGVFFYLILAGFLMWTESLARVHESRTLAAREAMLRAEAELSALRAQFNPHFVFNTLHSLMLLVRADPESAERAIEDVAALIRYASVLQRKGVDAVPLEEELDIARRYVALEQLRLQARLRVEWDIASGIGRRRPGVLSSIAPRERDQTRSFAELRGWRRAGACRNRWR